MPPLRNTRHEKFALLCFERPEENLGTLYLEAGFKCSSESARKNAPKLRHSKAIVDRITELQQEVTCEAVANVRERAELLTRIIRKSRIGYYFDNNGNINLEAIRESDGIVEFTEITRLDGSINRKIKVRDPIAAIQEMNKMDGVYDQANVQLQQNIVNINVITPQGYNLVQRVLEGERTE